MVTAGVWRLATGDIEPIRYTAGQQGLLHDQGAAWVVTVLVPRRRDVGFWRRILHDQTSAGLTRVLGSMENVNVTIVPFHLGRQPQLFAVRGT